MKVHSKNGLLWAAPGVAVVAMLLFVLVPPANALEVPYLSGQVVDQAGLISEATKRSIERKLSALEAETGAQVAILTVPSLERESLEEYTIRVVDEWQLGRADQDDGVLLFVAQKERRLRLEVGYGLEGELTDVLSGRILDNIVTPAFRQGDFGGGLERAVDAISAVIRKSDLPRAIETPAGSSNEIPMPVGCLFLFLFVFFFFVLPTLFRLADHRRGWSSSRGWSSPWIIGGGSSGGGFGGFSGGGGFGGFSGGGGGFGGGGASGGW